VTINIVLPPHTPNTTLEFLYNSQLMFPPIAPVIHLSEHTLTKDYKSALILGSIRLIPIKSLSPLSLYSTHFKFLDLTKFHSIIFH